MRQDVGTSNYQVLCPASATPPFNVIPQSDPWNQLAKWPCVAPVTHSPLRQKLHPTWEQTTCDCEELELRRNMSLAIEILTV
jgi:hypothetical protein